jgi:hypothetical protein
MAYNKQGYEQLRECFKAVIVKRKNYNNALTWGFGFTKRIISTLKKKFLPPRLRSVYPEGGGSRYFQNAGGNLPIYMFV